MWRVGFALDIGRGNRYFLRDLASRTGGRWGVSGYPSLGELISRASVQTSRV